MRPAKYVVVQYNPDPGRNELLNVGAIAWDGQVGLVAIDENAISRVIRENPRLDKDALLYLEPMLAEELRAAENVDDDWMSEWLGARPGYPVAFSEPRQTTVDPDLPGGGLAATIERLLSRTVRPKRRAGGGGQSPVQQLEQRFAPMIRNGRMGTNHVFESSRSGVPWSAHFFLNHGSNIAVDALNLELQRGEEVRTRAAAEAFKVADVRGSKLSGYWVYCVMAEGSEEDATNRNATRILEFAGAEVFRDPDALTARLVAVGPR